ncbi:tyrosinase family protein [Pseudomonas sp. NPDC089401]|uniref:tyrosinase family protein n=1 Tax=Pseudomonas sp. NPDC089401 TaxID=3364462 RepID=UPI00382B92DF
MTASRQDVATLGSGWNKTLLNYAKAMQAMDNQPLQDRTSWKFLGAMHGFDPDLWRQERLIQAGAPIPSDLTNNTFGDQCQHGSWYFLSWHRAYLFAFESIVAAKVKELTGDDWALPYWNYLDSKNPKALYLPDAFVAKTLPDGTANPLCRYPRRPGITKLEPNGGFSLVAMEEDNFLIGNGKLGFGGGITDDFVHFDNMTGALESNPHNTVHRLVGGYMGDPYLAGLDPIFWLHHCNIDRLWEAWMNTPGKTMVHDPRWLDGPFDRQFIVPTPGDNAPGVTFTSKDTLKGGKYYRPYDDLVSGTGVKPGASAVARVNMGSPEKQIVQPIGANAAVVTVGAASVNTRIDLEPTATAKGVASMGATTAGSEVTRLYLALEQVRGSAPSPLLEVYLNLPAGADPAGHPECLAGSLTLFGLNAASKTDGHHKGNGLGYSLDITDLAQRLEAAGDFDPDHLRVTLVPGEQISDAAPITVERISVLKRSGVVVR